MKDFLRNATIIMTVFVNPFLIYGLLHDPLDSMMVDKNQPFNIPEPNKYVLTIILSLIGLLIVTSIISVFKLYKKQKVFLPAPILTVLIICLLVVDNKTSPPFPSSTSEYEKDGYYYKMEIWWDTPNHINIYKRWKSLLPYNRKQNLEEMKYKLDSVSYYTEVD